jgi:plasmid maintenance system antidote protein VapI
MSSKILNLSITRKLRSAIEESGLTPYAIAKTSNLDLASISRFVNIERGLTLDSASKIAKTLMLRLEPDPVRRRRSLDVQLRAAIENDGRKISKIAKASGVDEAAIRRFISRERGLSLESASKIANALGLVLVKGSGSILGSAVKSQGKGRPSRPQVVDLAGETPDDPAPWKTPPKVRGHAKPLLTRKQHRVLSVLVEAGSIGLTGAELRTRSGVPGWRRMLTDLRNSDYQWAAVIHFPGKGCEKYHVF